MWAETLKGGVWMRASAFLCAELITFFPTVTKYLAGMNLKREGFILGYSWRGPSHYPEDIASGMVTEGGGEPVTLLSMVRKQRVNRKWNPTIKPPGLLCSSPLPPVSSISWRLLKQHYQQGTSIQMPRRVRPVLSCWKEKAFGPQNDLGFSLFSPLCPLFVIFHFLELSLFAAHLPPSGNSADLIQVQCGLQLLWVQNCNGCVMQLQFDAKKKKKIHFTALLLRLLALSIVSSVMFWVLEGMAYMSC